MDINTNNITRDWNEYWTDFWQRNILFMDVMRRRGNDMVTMTTEESANVLTFPIEKVMEGRFFERPINYWLARVLPSPEIPTNNNKRPYVVQDPRAGRGPGIAGFKKDSEIGMALAHGHPVYFIGFDAEPIGEQTYQDVIRGQVKFYQEVARLHPHSPKLCAIGNCAAGYLTMFSAMQEPELFGPILIAGSPLSYWNGERGRNPMRYSGGMIGGSWLVSLLGDIGGGRFDGTNLVMNFNLLNFDNFLWGKQYDLYANIDKDSERFLQFERWLSSFGEFNREEILWLVDYFFIGNKLTTGQLETEDGIRLDPRKITSPIITFISDGDNISPPAQSAGWIADLYHDVDEIIASGKTIVYCLNQKAGHLALFTGSKVAKLEDKAFVENMDTIDLLPPGLYELILNPPAGKENPDNHEWEALYVARTIEDIKSLGYNSVEDDRAFATLAKASESFTATYNNYIHPLFRMYHNPLVANFAKNMQPLRWSYWLFAEKYNPFMKIFATAAEKVRNERKMVSADNSLWAIQTQVADYIAESLKNLQDARDKVQEQLFFALWGNVQTQRFWDTDRKPPRYIPSLTQLERDKLMKNWAVKMEEMMPVTDLLSALHRMVVIILAYRYEIKQSRDGLKISTMDLLVKWNKEKYPQLTMDELRTVIANQFMVVWYDLDRAAAELYKFVLSDKESAELLFAVSEVLSQIENITPEMMRTMEQMVLKLNVQK